MTMRRWTVISPEYGEVVPVTDEGQGPMEYGCDVVEIEAESKRDALVLGVKEFRRTRAKYLDDSYTSPFAGVTVVAADCNHERPEGCKCRICRPWWHLG